MILSCSEEKEIKSETVVIGDQEWMTENLNVSVFNNGDSIIRARSKEEWDKFKIQKLPAYAEVADFEDTGSGKYYNYYAVKDPRGIIPKGFRLPSIEDWHNLTTNLRSNGAFGYESTALKSENGWSKKHDNKFGFGAYPNGSLAITTEGTMFFGYGDFAIFMSSTESVGGIYTRMFGALVNDCVEHRGSGVNIRCLKGEKSEVLKPYFSEYISNDSVFIKNSFIELFNEKLHLFIDSTSQQKFALKFMDISVMKHKISDFNNIENSNFSFGTIVKYNFVEELTLAYITIKKAEKIDDRLCNIPKEARESFLKGVRKQFSKNKNVIKLIEGKGFVFEVVCDCILDKLAQRMTLTEVLLELSGKKKFVDYGDLMKSCLKK